MKLKSPQKECYSKEHLRAIDAQRRAEEIACGPITFQVARLMIKFGVFRALIDSAEGLTMQQVAERCDLSLYAAKILLESSLTTGTVKVDDEGRFNATKTGWFLLNSEWTRVDMDFNHDVNYLGMFFLEEALKTGKPAGLKTLGEWKTIYEGLSQLPEQVQRSWFAFDHFYSDCSFDAASEIIFGRGGVRRLLDVGGNTGRFAMRCVRYAPDIEVTIMDLPQQIELMRKATAGAEGSERIHAFGADLLDPATEFPSGETFDAIMMSQFLDCFSEEQVVSILTRAAAKMRPEARLYIMETLWDVQRFETASFSLAQISVYFTAMANGNSKMFYSEDLRRCIEAAGLAIETMHEGLGLGHTLIECVKRQ